MCLVQKVGQAYGIGRRHMTSVYSPVGQPNYNCLVPPTYLITIGRKLYAVFALDEVESIKTL